MTEKQPAGRCVWCGEVFTIPDGPGRPRRFCRRSHRQRHYEARRVATNLGLGSNEVLISRSELDRLNDHLYALQAALEDVEGDVGDRPTTKQYADAFVHLLASALPLAGFRIEPLGLGGE